MEARDALAAQGIVARVVNMVSCERFDKQDRAYRLATLGSAPRVSIEAGSTRGWERYVGLEGASVGIDRFGASAPGKIVAEKLGMSVANIVATVKTVLGG
jgi:transketolase